MRAVTIVDGSLEWRAHPDPVPGRGELLVAVRAAGLNGADLLQRRGLYPPPPGSPPDIPGLEFAGEVVEAGPGTTRHGAGDRVMGIVGGGGQAELVAVDERTVLPVPAAVEWEAAGGFPEVFTTAHDALFTQAGLIAGERVLVSGAAGGVGTAGIQLAAAAGARVVATVRNPDLHEAVGALGAHEVVLPVDVAGAGPYDVVLELVGAASLETALGALATGARVVVIGVGGGSRIELDLRTVMGSRARIGGSTLRARSLDEKAVVAERVAAGVLPLLESGALRVPVAATYPMAEAAAAYDRFAAGGKLGKLVLVSG